jgi:hypothetical protein
MNIERCSSKFPSTRQEKFHQPTIKEENEETAAHGHFLFHKKD